jgi:hypothetical protein
VHIGSTLRRCASILAVSLSIGCSGGRPPAEASRNAAPPDASTSSPRSPPAEIEVNVRSEVGPTSTRGATRLIRFAVGKARAPRYEKPVALYLGNQRSGTIRAGVPARTDHWKSCAHGTFYGPPVCPISPLDWVRSAGVNGIDLELLARDPPASCMVTRGSLPPSTRRLQRVVVVPERRRASCALDFRVELYLEGTQIRAVNLVFTDP